MSGYIHALYITEGGVAFLTQKERGFLRAVANLGYCNPFLPERIQYEREARGADFREGEPVWSLRVADPERPHVNILRITAKVETLVKKLRERLAGGTSAPEDDLVLYETGALFLLYHRYNDRFHTAIANALDRRAGRKPFGFYADFLREWQPHLQNAGFMPPSQHQAPHLFACFFQIRRAFHHIFSYIIGGSMAAARLRAAGWQSIFTHDMRRYRGGLFERMGDITTLVP